MIEKELLSPIGPILAIALTIGFYVFGALLQGRLKSALANPVLIAIVCLGGLLLGTHVSYSVYFSAAQPIHLLLGPATVALAIPLVRSSQEIRRSFLPIVAALLAGSLTSAIVGYSVARLLGADQALALSVLPKGATTPIAMGVAQNIGGVPSFAAVFAVASGILVAVVAIPLFRWMRITDWRAVGLAAGTAGSGIGTSRVVPEDPVAAAFASVALSGNGLITAMLSPGLAAILKHRFF